MFALALLLRLCLWICCVGCINGLFVTQFSKYSSILKMSSNDNNNKKIKSTKFDRVIDDFMSKKYGSGQYFYGPRTSGLSEEEYAELRGVDINVPKNNDENESLEDIDYPLELRSYIVI
jgi:hypothetical protein